MSARIDAIRTRITADHAASMDLYRSITPEQWATPVPSDEGAAWTAKDVLAHVAVSEGGQLGQITRCIAGEVTVPDDFDLNRFNRRSAQKQADRTVEDMLNELETAHSQVLAALDTVSDADLDKTGRHARGDTLNVEQFFTRITEHRLEHAQQIKSAIAGQ